MTYAGGSKIQCQEFNIPRRNHPPSFAILESKIKGLITSIIWTPAMEENLALAFGELVL